MKSILITAALAVLFPTLACAQEVSGGARAVDGDTVNMTGMAIRLHGLDAPEATQTCTRAGVRWECGKEATELLARLIDGKTLRCVKQDQDDYGRMVAICKVGQLDLADAIVSAGFAIALPQFSQAYVESEARARSFKIGIWGSEFQTPADFRGRMPVVATRPTASPPPKGIKQPPRVTGVFYRNCAAARAAGAAPIYRGQPGYRPEMDGDGDGVACEPYRGRR